MKIARGRRRVTADAIAMPTIAPGLRDGEEGGVAVGDFEPEEVVEVVIAVGRTVDDWMVNCQEAGTWQREKGRWNTDGVLTTSSGAAVDPWVYRMNELVEVVDSSSARES